MDCRGRLLIQSRRFQPVGTVSDPKTTCRMELTPKFDGPWQRSVITQRQVALTSTPYDRTETRSFPVWDIRWFRDLVYLWSTVALLSFIPALILGAAIGRLVGRWFLCVLLSYAAAIALLALTRVHQGFRHPPNLIELLAYSAVFALPPILAFASVGYLVGRKLKERRDLKSH